jgi:hypothetical protein
MARAHLLFGIPVFVVFLVTGRFRRADFPDKEIKFLSPFYLTAFALN